MSNDFNFKTKKDPFNKNQWNNIVDPVNTEEEKKNNKIDISLLTDKDRAYYLAHGTLPKSEEEEHAANSISEALNQFEKNTEVVETFPEKKEEQPVEEKVKFKENHQAIINQLVEEKHDEEIVNQNLSSAFESMGSDDSTTQSTKIVTNWDEESTNEIENTKSEAESIDYNKQTIPTPTIQEPELPSFINRPIVKDNSGIIDPVKQQQLNINKDKETPVEEIIKSPHEEQTKSMKFDEVESTEETKTIVNEKQSPLFNKDPKEVLMSENEEEVKEEKRVFDTPIEKEIEEFDPTEDSTEKKTIDYGIVASDVNSTTVYNDLQKYVNDNYNFDNEDSAAKFGSDMENGESTLYRKNLLSGLSTANRDLDQSAMNDKDFNKLTVEIPDEIRSKNSKSKIAPNAIKDPNKIVSGKQATMLINATVRGAKKIFLYNSGFWVLVRPLTNFELSEYINTVRTRNMDYGKELGGHFYLYASLEIKKFFAERIKNIIIDSNLQNWKQGDVLINNISLQDFKTILWASACMMFKDGVEFTKICSFCNGTETVNMNLSKLDFYNFDAIKDSAYPFIMNKKTITEEDVVEYKNRIDYKLSPMVTINSFKYIFKVPTLNDYITFGDMFMNKMIEDVKDIEDTDKINNFVRYSHSKQYAPWISEIQQLDENNELIFKIVDGPTIFDIITDTIQDSKEFFDFAEKYIKATMLTYIAFPYIECPHCHKVPENILNGFVAYDIESAFFTMSVRKSGEIISQLNA